MRKIREKLAYILAEYKIRLSAGAPTLMDIVFGVVVWAMVCSVILLVAYMVIVRRLI